MTGLFLDTKTALAVDGHEKAVRAIRHALDKATVNTLVNLTTTELLYATVFGIHLHLDVEPRKLPLASAWISARVHDGLSGLGETYVGLLGDAEILPLTQFSIRQREQMLITWGSFPEKAGGLILSAASSFDVSAFDEDGYLKLADRA